MTTDELENEKQRLKSRLEELKDKIDAMQLEFGKAAFKENNSYRRREKMKKLNQEREKVEAMLRAVDECFIPEAQEKEKRGTDHRGKLREKDEELFEAVDEEDWEGALALADEVAEILNKLSDVLPRGEFLELDHGESYCRWNGSYDKFQGERRLGYWGELNDVEVPVEFSRDDFQEFNNSLRRTLYNCYTAKWLVFFGVKSDSRKVEELKEKSWPHSLSEEEKERIKEWKELDRTAKEKVRSFISET